MAGPKSRVQQFLLQSIVPIGCSIAVGYAFDRENVFHRQYGAFQFLWSGVVASLFYYLLVFLRARDAYLGLILIFVVTLLTTESTRPAFILRDIFYVGGLGLSIVLYFQYFRLTSPRRFAYTPFMLAGIYATVYIAASEFHLAILQTSGIAETGGNAVSLASTSAYFGVLIGLAVGCGISLNEKIWREKKLTG